MKIIQYYNKKGLWGICLFDRYAYINKTGFETFKNDKKMKEQENKEMTKTDKVLETIKLLIAIGVVCYSLTLIF